MLTVVTSSIYVTRRQLLQCAHAWFWHPRERCRHVLAGGERVPELELHQRVETRLPDLLGSDARKRRFHHFATRFPKLLFILYRFPRTSGVPLPLAYTVSKCAAALWLRFIGLPCRRGSGQANVGCLSGMPLGAALQGRGRHEPGSCGVTELLATGPSCSTPVGCTESCPRASVTGRNQGVFQCAGSQGGPKPAGP